MLIQQNKIRYRIDLRFVSGIRVLRRKGETYFSCVKPGHSFIGSKNELASHIKLHHPEEFREELKS